MINVKKIMADVRSSISDAALFLSREYRNYLGNVWVRFTGMMKGLPRVLVYDGNPEGPCFTDGNAVHLNLNADYVRKSFGRASTRYEINRTLVALSVHEYSHILWSSFRIAQKIHKKAEKDREFWPLSAFADTVPEVLEINSYLASNRREQVLSSFGYFDNVLEDAYIDNRSSGGEYSVGAYVSWLTKKCAFDLPYLEDVMKDDGTPADNYKAFGHMLLSYAKFHVVKCREKNRKHPSVQKLYEVADDIMNVLEEHDQLARTVFKEKVFAAYWEDVIKPYLDSLPEPSDPSEKGQMEGASVNLPDAPTGNGGSDASGSTRSQLSGEQKKSIRKKLQSPGNGSKCAVDEAVNNAGGQNDGPEEIQSGNKSLDSALNSMAERMAQDKLDEEACKSMNVLGQSVECDNRNIKVLRNGEIPEAYIDAYEKDKELIRNVSRSIVKNFRQKLKDRAMGGVSSGYYTGKTISMRCITRDMDAVFEKNNAPTKTPKLAVAYLGDCSGSMGGEKIMQSKRAASAIYDFCRELAIPVGIFGHEVRQDVNITAFSNFSINSEDKYRIYSMQARGCNRDGAALRVVAQQLLRQPADCHLLILTSDGLPSDYCSYDEAAADIKAAVKEYKRKGIRFIAAAMDEDKEKIKELYGDAFLDISDIEKMPKLLVSKISRFLD